jgi:hypothetical protein
MNCPKCAGFAPKTAIKCPACGAPMKSTPMAPPKPVPAATKSKRKPSGPDTALIDAAMVAPAARRSPSQTGLIRRVVIGVLGVGVLIGGLFSPPAQAAYDGFLVRRAAGALPLTTVSAAEMGAGTAQLKLPDGSTSAMNEKTHRQVYRFDRELEIANGRTARVAFDLTGYPAGIDEAILVGRKNHPDLSVRQETRGYKKFRRVRFTEPKRGDGVDHPGQVACHYQLLNRDETVFSVVFHYDEVATDPKAEEAVISLVLGSVQE